MYGTTSNTLLSRCLWTRRTKAEMSQRQMFTDFTLNMASVYTLLFIATACLVLFKPSSAPRVPIPSGLPGSSG